MQPSKPKRNTVMIGDGKPFPVSPEGLKQLQEQHDRLARSLPHLVSEAQRTADFGDRSENFEYQQAKGALRRTKIQLMVIQEQLNRAVLIPTGPNKSGTVQLGSTVIVRSATTGKESTFQILGSHETDPGKGRISNQSPLGAALLGKKVGATVNVRVADKAQEYTILKIT